MVAVLQTTPRKDECIEFVAFGMHEPLLLLFETGNAKPIVSDDVKVQEKYSMPLIENINGKLAEGWTVGNRTTLCPYDPGAYFIEWKRGTVATFSFNMGAGRQEDLARVKSVLDGVGNNEAAVARSQNVQLVGLRSMVMLGKF